MFRLFALFITLLPLLVEAEKPFNTEHLFDDVSLLSFTAGHIGVFDNLDKPQRYGIEYRGKKYTRWNLTPAFGYIYTANGADFYYFENKYDYGLSDKWILTPSLGLGLFQQSDEIDLGHSVEFRSGVEIARVFDNNIRLGAAFYHISNSRLATLNPGTESLVISVSIPL